MGHTNNMGFDTPPVALKFNILFCIFLIFLMRYMYINAYVYMKVWIFIDEKIKQIWIIKIRIKKWKYE